MQSEAAILVLRTLHVTKQALAVLIGDRRPGRVMGENVARREKQRTVILATQRCALALKTCEVPHPAVDRLSHAAACAQGRNSVVKGFPASHCARARPPRG